MKVLAFRNTFKTVKLLLLFFLLTIHHELHNTITKHFTKPAEYRNASEIKLHVHIYYITREIYFQKIMQLLYHKENILGDKVFVTNLNEFL